jgi:hypothetical protein
MDCVHIGCIGVGAANAGDAEFVNGLQVAKEHSTHASTIFLHPQAERRVALSYPALNDEGKKLVTDGTNTRLYIWGEIRYLDVFKELRITRYRLQYVGAIRDDAARMDWATALSTAAERMRRSRELRRKGLRIVLSAVRDIDVDALRRLGRIAVP